MCMICLICMICMAKLIGTHRANRRARQQPLASRGSPRNLGYIVQYLVPTYSLLLENYRTNNPTLFIFHLLYSNLYNASWWIRITYSNCNQAGLWRYWDLFFNPSRRKWHPSVCPLPSICRIAKRTWDCHRSVRRIGLLKRLKRWRAVAYLWGNICSVASQLVYYFSPSTWSSENHQ